MKDKWVWIVIGCIMVIGSGITHYTSSFIKSQTAQLEESYELSGTVLYGAENSALRSAKEEDGEASTDSEKSTLSSVTAAGKAPEAQAHPEAAAGASDEMPMAKSRAMAEAEEAEAADAAPSDVLQETVKSPLETDAAPTMEILEDKSSGAVLEISPLTGAGSNEEGPGPAADYRQRLKDLDAQIQKMREEDGGSNVYSIKTSAETELKMWEGEMNTVYSALLERLSAEDAANLSREQQAWIKDRDAQAAEGAKKNGGSMETLGYAASLVSLTRDRAYKLAEEYENTKSNTQTASAES